MVSLIPSILVHTPRQLTARLSCIEKNRVPVAQLDVADQTFVPATTYHDPAFLDTRKPKVALEIHLMTNVTPEAIAAWNYAWVQKIIFHVEATKQPRRILQAIVQLGKRAGMAVNPQTPIAAVQPFLGLVDTVLVMGVNPGWGGQAMLPDTVARVREARKICPRGNIEVDGGVNQQTASTLAGAGANLLVVGSALAPKNFAKAFSQLTALANAAYQNQAQ